MFSFHDLSRIVHASWEFPQTAVSPAGVSIDSRTLAANDFFIALRGPKFDAHHYLEEVFRKGASGAFIEKNFFDGNASRLQAMGAFNLFAVQDTYQALTDLASWYRSFFHFPFIGITGSVGKTSTKEFLVYLLRRRFSVHAAEGNLNNHIGLPLTLLRLTKGHQFVVAELGASHVGEIRHLAKILKPDAAVVTQISPAHLEGFGSLEDIYDAKLELIEALKPDSKVILPDFDAHLVRKARQYPVKLILVGETEAADYRLSNIRVRNSFVSFRLNERTYRFPGLAGFLSQDAAMALALALEIGLPTGAVPESWDDFKLPSGRFEQEILGEGIRTIYDGYNANPESFEKALEAFAALEVSGRKILVFADMLELGKEQKKYHETLGQKISLFQFDAVLAYGDQAKASIEVIRQEAGHSGMVKHFTDASLAADYLVSYLQAGDAVLFKASRGMKIEEVLKRLKEWRSSLLFRRDS